MRGYIEIVNWSKFQHYKHDNPLWVKLYKDLLDNIEYQELSSSDYRVLLFTFYMMGGRHNNKIPLSIEYIQRIGSLPFKLDIVHLQTLVNAGFIKLYNNSIDGIEEVYNVPIESVAQRQSRDRVEKRVSKETCVLADTSPSQNHRIEPEEVTAYWNAKARLPKIKDFNDSRKRKLSIRAKEPEFYDNWKRLIDILDGSDFHTGKNDRGWKATIDFLVDNTRYLKLLESPPKNKVSKTDLAIENLKIKYAAEDAAEKAKAKP
jgi:hypothetical protein